jgi:hypothetical protein
MPRVYWLSKVHCDRLEGRAHYLLVQFIPTMHFKPLLKRRELFADAQKVTAGLSLKRMVFACNSIAFYGICNVPEEWSEHSGLLISDVDMRSGGLLITETEADLIIAEAEAEVISGQREMTVTAQGLKFRFDFQDDQGQVSDELFFEDIEKWGLKAKRKKAV